MDKGGKGDKTEKLGGGNSSIEKGNITDRTERTDKEKQG